MNLKVILQVQYLRNTRYDSWQHNLDTFTLICNELRSDPNDQ